VTAAAVGSLWLLCLTRCGWRQGTLMMLVRCGCAATVLERLAPLLVSHKHNTSTTVVPTVAGCWSVTSAAHPAPFAAAAAAAATALLPLPLLPLLLLPLLLPSLLPPQIVFGEPVWVGIAGDNPKEEPLPLPAELSGVVLHEGQHDYWYGAGTVWCVHTVVVPTYGCVYAYGHTRGYVWERGCLLRKRHTSDLQREGFLACCLSHKHAHVSCACVAARTHSCCCPVPPCCTQPSKQLPCCPTASCVNAASAKFWVCGIPQVHPFSWLVLALFRCAAAVPEASEAAANGTPGPSTAAAAAGGGDAGGDVEMLDFTQTQVGPG
jgi:hypothetical protein